jgi:SAM-dependent methyltransferase
VRSRRCAEIGSGAGRIVAMMLEAGAEHVVAVAPSDRHRVAERNLAPYGDRVTCVHTRGEDFRVDEALDLILAVGVLQFIPDPKQTVDAAFAALRPEGRFFAWLYAREGTAAYRALVRSLRTFTRALPHRALAGLVRVVDLPLVAYMRLCRLVPLPLHDYLRNVLGRFTPEKRRLVI